MMKHRFSRYTSFIFTILLLVSAAVSAFSQAEKFDVKNTEAILISAAMREIHEKPRPQGDEALLITDKSEIARFVKLFDGNRKSGMHACGYHWRLTFVRQKGEPVEIWFNQDCEEFEKNTPQICEIMQAKFSQIKKNPTHFVTEIGIDVDLAPDEALDNLRKNAGFNIFVLGEPDDRFPFIEIEATGEAAMSDDRKSWDKQRGEATKKADALLNGEANLLRQSFAVLKQGETEFKMDFSAGGKFEVVRRLKILFTVGTKLDGIEKRLTNARLIKKGEPPVYFLQLVSRERFSESFGKQLSDRFPFIKQTFAYSYYPR